MAGRVIRGGLLPALPHDAAPSTAKGADRARVLVAAGDRGGVQRLGSRNASEIGLFRMGEQAKRPGPEPLQLGAQLVDQRRSGADAWGRCLRCTRSDDVDRSRGVTALGRRQKPTQTTPDDSDSREAKAGRAGV